MRKGVWPFGPKDEPVASSDSSGLFGAFGGVTGEETDSLTFTVGEQPVEGTGLLKRVTVGLVTMIRYATMVAVASFVIEEGPVGETGV